MISNRHWILLVAGCCCFQLVAAQDTGQGLGGTAAPPGATTTSPSGTSAPAPAATEPTGATSSFGTGTGATSSFGAAPTTTAPGGLGATGGGEPATGTNASGQGAGFGTPKAPAPTAPTFTLPAFYGSSASTFTAGEGRLARPKFRYNVSLSAGYDDNVFQTPTETLGTPAQEVIFLVDPGTPDQIVLVPKRIALPSRFTGGGAVVPQTGVIFVRKTIPGTAPRFQTVRIPGTPPGERVGSPVAQGGLTFDTQLFTRRSLFTFDINGSANFYANRPGLKQTDYNGATELNYLYRLTPRLQSTTRLNAAYLTQPDISRINTPQNFTGGAYISANAKTDVSYRWSPRFTTVSSLSYNALLYEQKAQQVGNYGETVFGTELRYLWSPKFTALAEVRSGTITYDQNPGLDSTSTFLLAGFEMRVNRKLSSSLRLGESLRTFELSGERASTPYMEGNVSYRLAPTSVVNLNTRFGFEEPFLAGQERQVLRLGLSFAQAFSPRLSAIVSSNYLHETSTNTGSDLTSTSDTYDANVRLEYAITKRFSINGSYSFTRLGTSTGFSDYYRSRLFIGGQYVY